VSTILQTTVAGDCVQFVVEKSEEVMVEESREIVIEESCESVLNCQEEVDSRGEFVEGAVSGLSTL